jgi:hypothetical protein
MRVLELAAGVLAVVAGLCSLYLVPMAGLHPLGIVVVALGALYLLGIGMGAYLHAAFDAAFGLGILWACALSMTVVSLVGMPTIGPLLLPAALAALAAAAAGSFEAEATEALG